MMFVIAVAFTLVAWLFATMRFKTDDLIVVYFHVWGILFMLWLFAKSAWQTPAASGKEGE